MGLRRKNHSANAQLLAKILPYLPACLLVLPRYAVFIQSQLFNGDHRA